MIKEENLKYPILEVDVKKIHHNIAAVVKLCRKKNIGVTGVIKGCNALPPVVREFEDCGCDYLGTSRVDQFMRLKEAGSQSKMMLIRIPMPSEIPDVVAFSDVSLNSEMDIVLQLEQEAMRRNKIHGVVLMADLGDLREGYWDKEELISDAVRIEEELSNVRLMGVGTNLGCYGSIKPTVEKMNELVEIAECIEAKIGRPLEIISGGATSSLPLILQGEMPERINNLRIGEGILLAWDLQELWGLDMSFLYQDAFTFQAQIAEVKVKPSHPVGEIFVDGFGNKPVYVDRGFRKRAILATGKLDYALNDKIIPRLDNFEILGASSDHMIADIEDNQDGLTVGDVVSFDICYPSMMYLTESPYVAIRYLNQSK